MREICWDLESTGLSTQNDRICELGAIEIENLIPTGREFHCYINPQMKMPLGAFNVHGLSDTFLKDKPRFGDVIEDFISFIGDAPLVAHNGDSYDIPMLKHEMTRIGRRPIENATIDTLKVSRQVRKGRGSHKLDAICKDYGISLAKRTKHGALLDAQILAEAYIELRGGRQRTLLAPETRAEIATDPTTRRHTGTRVFTPRLTPEEYLDHWAFIQGQVKNPVWADYA